MLSAHLIPGAGGPFVDGCRDLLAGRRGVLLVDGPAADVAVAPLLRTKLSAEQLAAARLGVLVFHPSLLPLRRGPDAVRWAVNSGDAWSGVTWFWANARLDAGPICEQELVALEPAASPGWNYRERLCPAGLRSLARALDALCAGVVRRVAQDERAATYQSVYAPPKGSEGFL